MTLFNMYTSEAHESGARIFATASKAGELGLMYVAGSASSVNAVWAEFKLERGVRLNKYNGGLVKVKKNQIGRYRSSVPQADMHLHLFVTSSMYRFSEGCVWSFIPCEVGQYYYQSPDLIEHVGQRVAAICDVPVLNKWYDAIAQAGYKEGLLCNADGFGTNVYAIQNDPAGWQDVVSSLLKSRMISFPQSN